MNGKMLNESGDGQHYPYSVDIDLPTAKTSEMYVRWLEIWLQSKCVNGWRLETFGLPLYHSLTGAKVYFQSPTDCVYFKLSPMYNTF